MGDAAYAVTRECDGSFHLHATKAAPRVVARIAPVLDRAVACSARSSRRS